MNYTYLAEVETLPEYITKYHDQRNQLTDQMNQKLKSLREEFEVEKSILIAGMKINTTTDQSTIELQTDGLSAV